MNYACNVIIHILNTRLEKNMILFKMNAWSDLKEHKTGIILNNPSRNEITAVTFGYRFTDTDHKYI